MVTTLVPELYPKNNIVNSLQGVKEYNVDMAATILTGAVPLAALRTWVDSALAAAD